MRGLVSLTPGLLASAGILICTWVSFQLGQNLASAGFLYLVCVVLAAVYGGFWQATWASVISVVCLDYFFNAPIFSLSVDRLSDWVELGAFEFTALVVSRLSDRARLREMEAVAERRDTERLYQTARRILLLDSPGDPGRLVTSIVQEVFELKSVILFDAQPGTIYEAEGGRLRADRQTVTQQTKETYILGSDIFEPGSKTWFCVLRLGVRPAGALALCATDMKPLTATAVASLAAIALERARAMEKQYNAEAARHAERLRTAVLDSLAHQIKTPLAVIRTASSGLPAAAPLSPVQTDLVTLIDQEARKLNDLASRLVSAPDLDSTTFALQPEPVLLSRLMKAAIQELERPGDSGRFRVSAPLQEPAVLADRELIMTALAQLIDNALKYSVPESAVDVELSVKDAAVVLTVRSEGLEVDAADRERIFDRFYRAPAAQKFSGGTGLGLSIVKAIAADHHGHVWADSEPGFGTMFSFSLPVLSAGATA